VEPNAVDEVPRALENGATWSGRGLEPKWLVEPLAAGRQVADFAI